MATIDVRRLASLAEGTPGGIRRMLVPLDGTPQCERIVPSAIVLARALNAEVCLVRAYSCTPQLPSGNRALFGQRPAMRETLHVASLYLARLEDVFRARGVRTYSRVLQWPVVSAILEVADMDAAGLIFLPSELCGDHGARQGQDDGLVQQVLRQSRAPVLVLPTAGASPFEREGGTGLRVLLAASNAPACAHALPQAEQLVRAFGGELTVLCAQETGAAPTAEKSPAGKLASAKGDLLSDDMAALLARTRARLTEHGIAVRIQDEAELPGESELAALAHDQADVLILSQPRDPRARERTIEVAARLPRTAACPVLYVPA